MSKPIKVVLTGGPCAGKTTLTQVIAHAFQNSVVVLPEAASLLFSGGFPRWNDLEAIKATQRAIYHVQQELEIVYAAKFSDKILVLDRGTVDGAAYWPMGEQDYFHSLHTSLEKELLRYDKVIYLESAAKMDYLAHKAQNPNRLETWEEAKRLDDETFRLWEKHPNFFFIKNERSFDHKIAEVISLIAATSPSSP